MGVFGLNSINKRKGSKTIAEYNNEHTSRIQEYFKAAIKSADERSKSLSYYYLGVIQNELGDKAVAQKSFMSALKFAKDDSLKNMIRKNLNL